MLTPQNQLANLFQVQKELDRQYKNLDFTLKKYQVVRRIINDLITDFRQETLKQLEAQSIEGADDIRCAGKRMAGFSTEMAEKNGELKNFLHQNVYNHRRVKRMEFKS